MPVRNRVLVVEDDRSIRDLVRAHLQLAGYEVASARDGAEALRQIQSLKPHAMVLDINMPEIDGFTVLEMLSKTAPGELPVLVLTARHAAGDVQRAIRLGAHDFLAKPFTEAQLIARVARLLRARPLAA